MVRIPRLPWDSLEDWGISLQVIKTALAAGLSWAIAHWMFAAQRPYFAPLAAILSIQATIAQSVSRGIQRILGVIAGIFLAFLFTRLFGLHAWSLALLVFFAMALATRLRLGPQGIPQVAISALLVIAIGSSVKGYAWHRAAETVLGAMVAALVSALLWPPDFTPDALQAVRMLSLGLSEVMDEMQADLLNGMNPERANQHLMRARAIESGLHQARRAIGRAETSLRWNPWHRGAKRHLRYLNQAIEVLDHLVMQVRGIARTLFVTLDRDVSQPSLALPDQLVGELATVIAIMADCIKSYVYLVQTRDPHAALYFEQQLQKGRDQRALILSKVSQLFTDDAAGFLDIASVLVDIDKMSQDLLVSSRLMIPLVKSQP